MAIKKSELFRRCVTIEQKEGIESLENIIDAELAVKYGIKHKVVVIDIYNWPDSVVRQEIARRFRHAGWTVEFDRDRDQTVDTIRLS